MTHATGTPSGTPDGRPDAIWEYATDLLIEIDRGGTVVSANPAFLRTIDATLDALVGQPLGPRLHPDDRETAGAACTAAFASRSATPLHFRMRGAGGGWIALAGTLAPFEADGRLGAVAVLRHPEYDRAEAILENVPGIVLVVELDGRVREANPYVLDLTHRTRDEVIGADWIDLFVAPEERVAVRTAFEQAQRVSPTGTHANTIVTREGDRRHIEWHGRVLRGGPGEPDVFLAVGNDVTERERALEEMRRGSSLMEAVLESTPSVIFALDRQGVFTLSDGTALARLGINPGDAVGQSVFERYARLPELVEGFRRAVAGESVHVRVAFRDDLIFDAAFAPYRDGQGDIAGVVGMGLDVTEPELQLRATAESEARLNAILQTNPECVKVIAPDGSLRFMNAAGLALIEAPSFEVVAGRPVIDLVAPEYHEAFQHAMAEIAAGRPVVTEFEIITLGGRRRRVRQHAAPLASPDDPDAPSAMLAVTHDVTAQREAESATRSAYDLTRAVVDTTPDWIFVKDADLRFVLVNRAFAEGQGLHAEEMIGRTARDFWSEELCEGDPERGIRGFHEDDREVLAGRTVHVPSLPSTLGTGEVRIFDTLKAPFRDREGRIVGVLGYSRDVTEREAARAALHRSEALLSDAEALAHVGAWTARLDTGEQTWTDENYRLLGLEPGSVPSSFESFISHVHPDDRAGIIAAMESFRDGSLSYRFRVICPNGEIRQLESSAHVVTDTAGNPVRIDGVTQDVTEREETLAALRHSSGLLEQAQRQAKLGNWVLDHEIGTLTWSSTVFEIFELDPEVFAPSYDTFLASIHPDDRDAVNHAYTTSLVTREPYLITHRLLMPDGRVKWLEERAESDFADDGAPLVSRGTVQDVTEQILLRDAADRTAHELARIVESSPLPIIVADERGTMLSANTATERTFGWGRDALIGKNVAILAAGIEIPEHNRYIEHYRATGEASTAEGLVIGRTREVRARRADGTEFPADLTVADIEQADGTHRYVGILLDRTEWRAREEQIIRMQKLDAMGTLIAGVAHDFNNLLTAIIGGLEMAIARPDEPRWTEIARDSAERAAELVQRLLRFSRDEPPNRHSVAAAPIVEAVVALARETMDRRIWFSTEIEDGLPPILADAGQIEQVLLNLVLNARDAVIDRAGISDEHYRPSVRVTLAAEAREDVAGVAIRVADNGTGMSENVRRRAFDPFFTTKSVDRGTGLGLSIATSIVTSHQGALDLDTREGSGTTFTLWLPSPHAAEPTPAGPRAAAPVRSAGGLPTRGRVLLVDDEPLIAEVAEAYLAGAGFEVVVTTSGAEAIRLARDFTFDIAVIDLNMPPPDGWAVLGVLRVLQPNVPMIIASGFAAAADVAERGGAALVAKPYSRDQLVRTVSDLLR